MKICELSEKKIMYKIMVELFNMDKLYLIWKLLIVDLKYASFKSNFLTHVAHQLKLQDIQNSCQTSH